EDVGIMYVTGYASTSFVPMAGQVGRGTKGISVLKAANKVPVKNGSTNMLKNHFYNKDYITQRFEKAKAEIGKKRIPVFYKQELATDVTNTKTYGIEMKPLHEVKPQMFLGRDVGEVKRLIPGTPGKVTGGSSA